MVKGSLHDFCAGLAFVTGQILQSSRLGIASAVKLLLHVMCYASAPNHFLTAELTGDMLLVSQGLSVLSSLCLPQPSSGTFYVKQN